MDQFPETRCALYSSGQLPMKDSPRLPDFIIIGAMKSATSTLHNQLSAQPGIFMSTPKEPNFFSDDDIYSRGLSWYTGLFHDASSGDICGESSTHYTKLPDYPDTISRLKSAVHQPKLIYVMRHPIDRLVSHYMHQWSEGVISCDINRAIDRYPELINYSCYGMQLQPYLEAFGSDALLLLHFEDLKKNKDKTLEMIGEFLGLKKTLHWVDSLDRDNVSSQRIRRFPGYEILVNSKPMAWIRQHLIPQWVRDRIKKKLSMQKRPKISPDQYQRLMEIFDRDLKVLSNSLGIEITYASFEP